MSKISLLREDGSVANVVRSEAPDRDFVGRAWRLWQAGDTPQRPAPSLEQRQRELIEAIRTEAEERITAALGTDDSMDAVSRRLEQLMTALVLTRREATGRINAAQTAVLDGLEAQAQHLQAIRAAARSAISAIKSAETVEAVDAVTVEWPA